MKKIIQTLIIIILTSLLALIIIFVFNPYELRTKLIGNIINSYFSSTIKDYEADPVSVVSPDSPLVSAPDNAPVGDKNPLLNAEQEKTLESYGVDVDKLPKSISPAMEACFIEKLGSVRAQEIVKGSAPSAMEIFKAKSCLGE